MLCFTETNEIHLDDLKRLQVVGSTRLIHRFHATVGFWRGDNGRQCVISASGANAIMQGDNLHAFFEC